MSEKNFSKSSYAEDLRVATDAQLEREPHPIGHVVHYSTVTHAWRGTLVSVTASHYVLKDAKLIDETGPISDYSPKSGGQASDASKFPVMVSRGAVSWAIDLGPAK